MTRERFIITLQAEADPHNRSGTYRLRGLLKVALRQFGLRCVRMEAAKPAPDKPTRRRKTGRW